ncbi:ATP-binding protein [Cohnella cholangitidis]|uniref:histidine kinase n=1 Tax=Cohnella cholangitidis TaxID=2598458 RepID=A0A7G5BSL6_9BACL|nr:ATP-binding protein [Cohnella cholangitidis]QMV39950.1 PAS domain S-box protein [Cohnella cholangitidis]
MSIKAKLSLLISIFVTLILTLNISIYYYSSKNELEDNVRQEMVTIAKQIGTSLDAAEKSKKFMEDTIGEKLRATAVAAKSELDPSIVNVTNEQLAKLSTSLGVDHISLWKRTQDNIVVLKSSEPSELNMGSKSWDYWYTAFNQLLDDRKVTIPQGQKLLNYWSGPYQYASSDPERVNKWGYYYDGTTDYIINPYINAQVFLDYENKIGTTSLINHLLEDNPDIVGITGFDPRFFGKPQIVKVKKGKVVHNLDVRDVPFGDYTFQDKDNDVANVRLAAQSGQIVTTTFTQNGKEVIKSFIPLSKETPYVISVNFDYGAIKDELNRQLFIHSVISFSLIVASWIASYLISGFLIRPLHQILNYVNEIAEGKFDSKIAIRSQDELGLLSSRVNAMADNLHSVMGRLRDSAEELRNTKEYLESFVNHTSDAIHVTNLQGRIIQVNDAFETMYGWSREESLNRKLKHIPEGLRQEYEELRMRIERGQSVADYETMRLRKDSRTIDVSITLSPIRDEEDRIMAFAEISRNITARKQTEEVIRRSEKLSVIGQLAAGVAHEIRNPLTTLRGFVQLNKQQGALSDAYLDVMLSELDRINFIVSEFLILAKPQIGQFVPVDIRSLLQDMVSLLDSQASLINASFETRFAGPIPPVECDANQLKQVFINIIKNSLEAMEQGGGTITVELEFDSADQAAVIRVKDQGHGISEEDLPKLCEPFFTSKASGNGLGLMVSHRIIANHKGTMSFSSKLGKGTCVEIRLPARDRVI